MTKSCLEKVKELTGLSHVETFKKLIFLIILVFQIFLTKKLRINTINRPNPINAKEKVNKKYNPIIKVLILEDILWTISDELDGLCNEK